jgi:hypothetical protein
VLGSVEDTCMFSTLKYIRNPQRNRQHVRTGVKELSIWRGAFLPIFTGHSGVAQR